MPFDASIILGSKPIDTNQNALQQFLQLRQMKDQMQMNALAQQAHQLQIQQTQTSIAHQKALQDLFAQNPDAPVGQAIGVGGSEALPYVKAKQEAAVSNSTIGLNTAKTKEAEANTSKALTETQSKIQDDSGLHIALPLYKLAMTPNGKPDLSRLNQDNITAAAQSLATIDKKGAEQLLAAFQQGGAAAAWPLIVSSINGSKSALEQLDKEKNTGINQQKADQEGRYQNSMVGIGQQNADTAKQTADQTGRYQQGELRNSGILAGVAEKKEKREQEKQDIELGGITPNAKAISDLLQPPPSNRNPLYNRTMIDVNDIRRAEGKPAYDATEWEMKQKTADDFASSGDSGKAAIALNTLVRHSYDMKQVISKLGNGDFTPGNRFLQMIGQMTGHSAPTNFDQLKQYVVGETVKLIRGSGGSEADVKRAEETLNRQSSPKQLADAMDINFEVAGGKMQAMNQVARRYMKKADFNVLDPEAGKLLDQMGYDTETLKRKPKQAAKPTLSKEDQALADKYKF